MPFFIKILELGLSIDVEMKSLVCSVLNVSILIFIAFLNSSAQEAYIFKKALVVNADAKYGREALYTDPLAYQLYNGTIKTPAEGAVFGQDAKKENITWKTIEADSNNRLINRMAGRGPWMFRGGSYMYFTYNADKAKPALLNVQGASGLFLNGEPHTTDPYGSGWLNIPVQLKKGLNEIYIRGAYVKATLDFPSKPVAISVADSTFPHIVAGNSPDVLQAAIVISNTSSANANSLQITTEVEGEKITTSLPPVPAMSVRKVPFQFSTKGVSKKGKYDCVLTLTNNRKEIDRQTVSVEAFLPTEQYSSTFISDIDGSLQYYSVSPQTTSAKNSALFLSVHGAGVEAINQARAYKPKDWGNVVAATNRRPRGFNWEDWGRLDALEVLNIAKQKFNPDPQKIYLTGHSMGGHGTWFLGATYPDKWASIAPCAGYPTLKGYGSADGLIPDTATNSLEKLLLRSSNQSDVIRLANNYKSYGVYIFHGDSDKVVSVDYARQMKKILADFHKDMSYYEYPGGEHWFGDISVDWQPLFDFFKWHKRPLDSAVNNIDFITSSPGISADYYWTSVYQQHYPLKYSTLKLNRNKSTNTISGATENVRILKLKLNDFASGTAVKIVLDSNQAISYTAKSANDSIFLLNESGKWQITTKPSLKEKGPHRYGTLKDAFNHRMLFVYGTAGSKEENAWSLAKAKYDAETWYYRGNGAVDIIADKEYAAAKYKDRGVIIYGNENTNSAWKLLLSDCPISVSRNNISVGDEKYQGNDLSAYFIWPSKFSDVASVGVVAGTGIKGMKAANANQYFAGASGFPDFMIYNIDMLLNGAPGVKAAGFFNYKWSIDKNNMEVNK